jgi:hypothetical protein
MRDDVFVWTVIIIGVIGLGALLTTGLCGVKNVRKQNESATQCRVAIDAAEQFQKTKPRVCPEDSVECRKLERELFLAVTSKCAKVVK